MEEKSVLIFILTIFTSYNCQKFYGDVLKWNVEFISAHYKTWKEIERREIYSFKTCEDKLSFDKKVNVEMKLLLGYYYIT